MTQTSEAQLSDLVVRGEEVLLAAARTGDGGAFETLARPHQRELHVHCYRMLGTLTDADDALQETLLRAWRYLDRFASRSSFRAWLYRIATNVCLTMLERRTRQGEVALGSAGEARDASSEGGEPVHLQPYPDRFLDDSETAGSPATIVERREDVELAFCAAIQALPARQRATLLLREVIGYPAAEVAAMLETSVASVNSMLQRARATLAVERDRGTIGRAHASPGVAAEEALVRRLVAAWHAADVPAITALLTEDALFSMPPEPQYFVGREAIAGFLTTVPARGRLDRFRLVPTRANRQPALAIYSRDGDLGAFRAHGILVLAFEGGAIASLTRFGDESLNARFGLPSEVEE